MGASSGSGLSQAGLHLRWPIRLFQWECYQLGKGELSQNPDVQPHRGEEADSWMNGRLENACLLLLRMTFSPLWSQSRAGVMMALDGQLLWIKKHLGD